MATVDFNVITDTSSVITSMGQAAQATQRLTSAVNDVGAASQRAFTQAARSAGTPVTEIRRLQAQLAELREGIVEVGVDSPLGRQLIVDARQIHTRIQEITRDFRTLDAAIEGVDTAPVDDLGNSLANVEDQSNNTTSGLDRMAEGLVAAFSVAAIGGFITKVVETRAEFQKFEAVLTNTLGSNSAAKKVLEDIQTFASQTPFSVKEVTESFVKLANQGFEPTNKELTKLGDLAASQGKSFDQLTEGIIDAQTGEFERLKEFGIKSSKEGDKVRFTFKGVQTQVKNTGAEINKYILSLGELQGVSGGMAAISETLGGKISNLGDNFDALFNNLGESSEGVFGLILDGFNEILGKSNEYAKEINKINASLKSAGLEQSAFEKIFGSNEIFRPLQNVLTNIEKRDKNDEGIFGAITGRAENIKKLDLLKEQMEVINRLYKEGTFDLDQYTKASILLSTSIESVSSEINKIPKKAAIPGPTKEQLDAAKKALKDYESALMDIYKRAQDAETNGLTGLERINREKEIADQELRLLEETFLKKQAAAGKGNALTAEQQEAFLQLQLAIDRKYGTDTLALDIQLAEQRAALRLKDSQNRKKDADNAKAFSDLQTEIKIEEIEALKKPTGLSEEDFEKQKAVAVLEIKKQAAAEQLTIKIEQVRSETGLLVEQANNEASILEAKGDEESAKQAARLRDSAKQIQISGDEQERLLKLQTENAINELNDGIEEINKPGAIKKVNWGEIFGLTEDDKKNIGLIGDQLKQIAQGFLDAQNLKLDNELDLIEKGMDARQEEIEDIQSKLQEENNLRDAGYANNAALLEEEIANKKKAQEEDIENQKKLQKEKERLRKQQLLLDQAQQASSLITAIAEIYASTASAGPFGVALAAITIAAMLGAFAFAQGKASAAVNAADSSFYKGGYVGDGDKYQEMGTVHGGEFVTTKEKTKQHRTLLEGIHSGDHKLIRIGVSDLLKDTGVSLMSDIPEQLNATKHALKESEINLMLKTNNAGMERRIENLGTKLDKIVHALGNSEVVMPNGNRIIKNGNLTTIIKAHGS